MSAPYGAYGAQQPYGAYPGYPQGYGAPMMMDPKMMKNQKKMAEVNLKFALNKVCGLNFLTEKDYKKMPMMPGMMPTMQQPNTMMYMDKKTKKENFKRGATMFFQIYPQTMMMQMPQLEQHITTNKAQVMQLFQPMGMMGMGKMPTMAPTGVPMQAPGQYAQPGYPPTMMPGQPMAMPGQPMPGQPMPGQPMPIPGQAVQMPGQPMYAPAQPGMTCSNGVCSIQPPK